MSKADAGAALVSAGQNEEAVELLTRAVRIDPQDGAARINLAIALRNCNRFPEALHEIALAADLRPGFAELWNTLGMLSEDLGDFEHAVRAYHEALPFAIDDGQRQQIWLNYAYALLRMGRFEEAWPYFEAGRLNASWAPPPGLRVWEGEEIGGKRLLVLLEGGYGDGILFARWFPQLHQMCAVSFLVWDALAPLFEDAVPYQRPWIIRQRDSINPSDFDYCVPLMSLPCCLGMRTWSDIPHFQKYIHEDVGLSRQWLDRLLISEDGPAVGVCWHAEETGVSRKHRSIPVEHFELLREVRPDAHFFSLCPGVQAPVWMTDHTRAFLDWAATAAFVANLDLVITADTAVAHLAGALGIPTWIVLPCRSDWKYGIERSDTPWYPSARLFRQQHPTDWRPVMEDVANGLKTL